MDGFELIKIQMMGKVTILMLTTKDTEKGTKSTKTGLIHRVLCVKPLWSSWVKKSPRIL